jgi:pyrroloquinoline quinone biosynthesis protein E
VSDTQNGKTNGSAHVAPPTGMLAELTHRCPLQCPYCSNPLELHKAADELDTKTWFSVFDQAAELGVLQVHLSGGEPTLRDDLEDMVAHLTKRGIYANLITAGVTLDRDRLARLSDAGLAHVQLSFQSVDAERADRIGNAKNALAKKLETAAWARELGLAITLNAPIHRQNIDEIGAYFDKAVEIGAERIEIAHVQYYGWALKNRAALIPSAEQTARAQEVVDDARLRLKGILNIDCVVPDYYAKYPKPCMCGWGNEFLAVTPTGVVLPCHAAQTIPTLEFDNVKDRPLAEIWWQGSAFQAFRGTDWMQEPCRGCARKEIDFGGCRCQAYALTGDAAATDPACTLSPHHGAMRDLADGESADQPTDFIYRRIGLYSD